MDQERWTPDASATDVLEGDPHEWPTLPTAAYLGDPRWGIRADLPASPIRGGMPADDLDASAPMHSAIGPVRSAPLPVPGQSAARRPVAGPAATAPATRGPLAGAPGAAPVTATGPVVPAPRTAPPIVTSVPRVPAPPSQPTGQPPYGAPSFAPPSFGPPSFAPAGVTPRPAASPSPAPAAVPAFLPVPLTAAAEQKSRPARRAWLVALAVVLVLGVVGAAVAAVGLPMLLRSGNDAALQPLRSDLTLVAAAQAALHAQTGTYSADPTVVAGQLRGAVASQVVILRADSDDWCGEAIPAGETAPRLYFSQRGGFSEQSCA